MGVMSEPGWPDPDSSPSGVGKRRRKRLPAELPTGRRRVLGRDGSGWFAVLAWKGAALGSSMEA
jgi:hypothetical protein